MISNDIERKVVVTAPRMIRAAQITAFRRSIQVDEDAALAGFDQGKLVKTFYRSSREKVSGYTALS
jgi:hypothetical protein